MFSGLTHKMEKGKTLSTLYEIKIIVVVRARWTVDIGFNRSVVEHLISEGVPGSTSGPAIHFHLYAFVYVCIC